MKLSASVVVAGLFLLATFPVLAGGGLVEWLSVKPGGGGDFANPGDAYIVTARVNQDPSNGFGTTNDWCKQCPVKIKFENPQNGDIVNPLSDKTDDNGQVEAKVASTQAAMRTIYLDVTMPNGVVYSSSRTTLNFTGKMQYWTENGYVDNPQLVPSGTPSTVTITDLKPAPTFIPAQTTSPSETTDTAQLNQKINDLQKQLDQSKKEQNFLQSQVNWLMNFIKHLFPFFK